jgi:hypothetical protein
VPQIDHGGTADVVGVEGALTVGVGRRVVVSAADSLVRSVRLPVGVRPQHTEVRLGVLPVGCVAGLFRRPDRGAKEVEVCEIREPDGGSGGDGAKGR